MLQLAREAFIPPLALAHVDRQWLLESFPRKHGRSSKTRTQDDVVAIGVHKSGRKGLVTIVRVLHRVAPPKARLFPFAFAISENVVHLATAALRLLWPVTPHMFRHGGALQDAINKIPLEIIQIRGMWRSQGSALRYSRFGRYLEALRSLPLGRRHHASELPGTLPARIAAQL